MKRISLFAAILAYFLFTGCGASKSYLELSESPILEVSDNISLSDAATSTNESPSPIPTILIHVSGAVACPGVYELSFGSRIYEAIDAAGGLLPDADTGLLNLASPLSDGTKITVPLKGENTSEASNIVIGSSSVVSGSTNGKISINSADAATLTTIPGIGPSKAAAIVKYREENGLFKSISDLTNVSGIGEATLKRIQDVVVL